MKRTLFAFIMFAGIFASCDSTKKTPTKMADLNELNGTWELNFISGPRIAFEGLYPDRKPFIAFDVAGGRVSGNTSCNNFNGKLNASGSKISFADPMAMTKMFCEGQGESTFMSILSKVDSWTITEGNTLNLKMGDVNMMRFVKKQ